MAYTSSLKQNLPVYGLKNKELREFTTTAQDKDKGISRIPLPLARIYEEDILDDSESDQMMLTESLEILDNYQKVMEHRHEAFQTRTKSSNNGSQYEKQVLGFNIHDDQEETLESSFSALYSRRGTDIAA
jgi:hypothetical protein